MYACECYVATASFLVSPENTVPLKFHELDRQVLALIKVLTPEDAWVHRTNITEVKSSYQNINGNYYSQYKLIEMSVCPTQAGEIKIPALDFVVAKTDNEGTFQDSLLFQSKPHTITVHPVPVSGLDSLYTNDYYQMVGEFEIEEDFEHIRKIFPTGDTINYTFSIVGRGNTFPIGLNLYPKNNHDLVVILDISESMYIEDYGTDRISKGIDIVNYILLKHIMLKEEKESPLVVIANTD